MQTMVEFTAIAERHARSHGILPLPSGFTLPEELMRGDIVEFATARGPQFFKIGMRRLQVGADGSQRLVLRLDHPVR